MLQFSTRKFSFAFFARRISSLSTDEIVHVYKSLSLKNDTTIFTIHA